MWYNSPEIKSALKDFGLVEGPEGVWTSGRDKEIRCDEAGVTITSIINKDVTVETSSLSANPDTLFLANALRDHLIKLFELIEEIKVAKESIRSGNAVLN